MRIICSIALIAGISGCVKRHPAEVYTLDRASMYAEITSSKPRMDNRMCLGPKDPEILKAVNNADYDSVQHLIAAHTDVNMIGPSNIPPLCLAARLADSRMVQMLLHGGATVRPKSSPGRPIAEAATGGSPKVIKLLVENGADVNEHTQGDPPIMWAAIYGNVDAVNLLIILGARVDELSDADHETSLLIASEYGFANVIKVLLSSGADPTISNSMDQNAIFIAANASCAELLLKRSPSLIDMPDLSHQTPLMNALEEDEEDVVELLLARNAQVNITSVSQDTALHIAVRKHNLRAVKLFVMHGAHLSIRNWQSYTPKQMAEKLGEADIVEYLSQAEGDR